MKKEIEKNDLEDLVIDRAKSNEEIPNRIDTLTDEFQGLVENKESSNEREEEGIPGLLGEEIRFAKGKWKFQEKRNAPE